jgi:hypothetical protein
MKIFGIKLFRTNSAGRMGMRRILVAYIRYRWTPRREFSNLSELDRFIMLANDPKKRRPSLKRELRRLPRYSVEREDAIVISQLLPIEMAWTKRKKHGGPSRSDRQFYEESLRFIQSEIDENKEKSSGQLAARLINDSVDRGISFGLILRDFKLDVGGSYEPTEFGKELYRGDPIFHEKITLSFLMPGGRTVDKISEALKHTMPLLMLANPRDDFPPKNVELLYLPKSRWRRAAFLLIAEAKLLVYVVSAYIYPPPESVLEELLATLRFAKQNFAVIVLEQANNSNMDAIVRPPDRSPELVSRIKAAYIELGFHNTLVDDDIVGFDWRKILIRSEVYARSVHCW